MSKKRYQKDALEKFVADQKDAFDLWEPSDDLWKKIDHRLGHEKTSKLVNESVPSFRQYTMYWRMIAMLLIGFGIGYGVFLNKEYGFIQDPQLAITAPTYAREFTRYAAMIEEKRADLYILAKKNPEVYEDSSRELDQLEQNYQKLRKELTKIPNQEELIQAMIQNLQWQIEILNQQLTIINHLKSHETGKVIHL